jgi:hypothetical protein
MVGKGQLVDHCLPPNTNALAPIGQVLLATIETAELHAPNAKVLRVMKELAPLLVLNVQPLVVKLALHKTQVRNVQPLVVRLVLHKMPVPKGQQRAAKPALWKTNGPNALLLFVQSALLPTVRSKQGQLVVPKGQLHLYAKSKQGPKPVPSSLVLIAPNCQPHVLSARQQLAKSKQGL